MLRSGHRLRSTFALRGVRRTPAVPRQLWNIREDLIVGHGCGEVPEHVTDGN